MYPDDDDIAETCRNCKRGITWRERDAHPLHCAQEQLDALKKRIAKLERAARGPVMTKRGRRR